MTTKPFLPHLRRLFSRAALLACLLAVAPGYAAEPFLSQFDDLPLAPGLSELPGGMLFETDSGSIVEANAEGSIRPEEVAAFYEKTLPQLGWTKISPGLYMREDERLSIAVESGGPGAVVHFSLAPKR